MVLIKTKDGKKALLNTKATSIREYEEEGEEPPTYGLCTLTIPAHAYFCLYRWSMSLSSLFRMFTNKGVHKGTVFFTESNNISKKLIFQCNLYKFCQCINCEYKSTF